MARTMVVSVAEVDSTWCKSDDLKNLKNGEGGVEARE